MRQRKGSPSRGRVHDERSKAKRRDPLFFPATLDHSSRAYLRAVPSCYEHPCLRHYATPLLAADHDDHVCRYKNDATLAVRKRRAWPVRACSSAIHARPRRRSDRRGSDCERGRGRGERAAGGRATELYGTRGWRQHAVAPSRGKFSLQALCGRVYETLVQSVESSTLPSSSPFRFPSTVIPDDEEEDEARRRFALPGEREQRPYEEGELCEERTPPSNQQSAIGQAARWGSQPSSTHARGHYPSFLHPSAQSDRKRHWSGSQGSEEQARPIRKQRCEDTTPAQRSMQLPPISEFLTNPWGAPISTTASQNKADFSDARPAFCSTPRTEALQNSRRSRTMSSHFEFDSRANVSGQPPTPFSRANTAAPSRPTHGPGRDHENDRRSRTSDWAAQTSLHGQDDGMRYGEEDGESSALLRTPPRANRRRDGETAADLREALADPPSPMQQSQRAHARPVWQGGYAPKHWSEDSTDAQGRRRYPAVDDLNANDDRDRMDATFSPIPYTKAWQYQQDMQRERARRGYSNHEQDEREHLSASQRANSRAMQEDPDSAREASGASQERLPRALSRASQYAAGFESRDYDTGAHWREGTGEDVLMMREERWKEYEMLPTAVVQAPVDNTAPTLAENPRDQRWTVHFDDPEKLVCGQSARWQNSMWHDPTAVIFTAYNYRYTSNGVVNRHLENAAANIIKHVTGEEIFDIVPPHPDPTRTLSARELPFTWGVRGLTMEGAAALTAIRVASSQGVSIITFPRRLGIPGWICGLVGFLRPNVKVIAAAVREVLEEPTMLEWITRMTKECRSLRAIPCGQRAAYIISTLEIRIAELGKGDFMANVHIESPTDDMAEFRTWVAHLRGLEYNNFLNGAGTARAIYYCGGCRGVDHDTMSCPFPEMRGWQGTRQGAQSHTSDILETMADGPKGNWGGPPRGNGVRGGKQRGGRTREAEANSRDRGGRDSRDGAGRNDGRWTRTPAGRSPWTGGQQQSQQQRGRFYPRQ